MLNLLVVCIVALIIAGVAIWLLSYLTLDAKIQSLIKGLILVFAVLFVIVTLWNGRGAFGLH